MDIGTEIGDFLTLVKESNFNFAEVYGQAPMAIYIIVGGFITFVIAFFFIKSSLRKSSAMRVLKDIDDSENSFSDYNEYMQKIAKFIPSATAEFSEVLEYSKKSYYKAQLRLLENIEIDEKILKYQQMSKTYMMLSDASSSNEELSLYFSECSQELLSDKLQNELSLYIEELVFDEESLSSIEAIVTYANRLEEPETVLNILTKKLQNIDFGSSLEIFMFVRSLDSEKLAQIYDFCMSKQNTLFETPTAIISSEILDYLLENDEKDKVYHYIKSLSLATYLQELYYKYFNQKDSLEFDLIFVANKTEINADYKNYLENLLTENWRNDIYLEILIGSENVADTIGHMQDRQVIERIDRIRKDVVEKQILDEALQTARQAEIVALEAKNIADGNLSKAQSEALEKLKTITMSEAKEKAQQLENDLKKNEDTQSDEKIERNPVTVEVKKEVEQIEYSKEK